MGKTVKFVVEIADTPKNNEVFEGFGDLIAVADEIAEVIVEMGFSNVKVKEEQP